MDRLEDALREALRRKEAPVGFAERVLTRDAASNWWGRFWLWFEPPSLKWAGAAALTLVLLAGYQYTVEQRRRSQGEAAREQVLLALRITADKVEYARAKVQRVLAQPAGVATKPANFI